MRRIASRRSLIRRERLHSLFRRAVRAAPEGLILGHDRPPVVVNSVSVFDEVHRVVHSYDCSTRPCETH
jgi:hypothetical protein